MPVVQFQWSLLTSTGGEVPPHVLEGSRISIHHSNQYTRPVLIQPVWPCTRKHDMMKSCLQHCWTFCQRQSHKIYKAWTLTKKKMMGVFFIWSPTARKASATKKKCTLATPSLHIVWSSMIKSTTVTGNILKLYGYIHAAKWFRKDIQILMIFHKMNQIAKQKTDGFPR